MLLKNTAKFRENWKHEQGYDMPHWDEHFIGANHEETSGFYKMVNGIVNNIKADLTPKLQNAQDAQAIYEFLQNGADSQATDCAILYNENYFFALNNGKPFSVADVRAVLNSFQGTKADKTKAENCGKIGRYGIGFKLVHRLVGKFDGADELLNDLAGPVLFSWGQQKQFDELMNFQEKENLELHADFSDNSPASWLIKIVLSCFPVSPDEKVKDLAFKERAIFQKNEVLALADFMQENKHLLQALNTERGSLIFLKFGEKKYEKLKDSLENLKSGIGYSLNLLKTLKRVVLQDEIIERFSIATEQFMIDTNEEEFKKIDPEFPFCPIEITLGYETNKEHINRMKNAPSIYQYFPMRGERHNSAFFLHSTSFNKVTDRTHLDDQGEANFATLQYVSEALKEKLNQYKRGDFQRFTQLYGALLASDKPDKYNSKLISEYLYKPFLEYLKTNIPTNKQNAYPKELVLLKKTKLPVEPMNFGIAKEWFYWTDAQEADYLHEEAIKNDKLGLPAWGLKMLLQEGNPALIGEWFATLTAKEYEIFVEELQNLDFDRNFMVKFTTLKVFRCVDAKGKANYFSIDELKAQENVFLVDKNSKIILNELKIMGFSVMELNISDFKDLQNALKGRLDYLLNGKSLFTKILPKMQGKPFTNAQKHNLFNFLSEIKDLTPNDLKEISIFTNQKQEIKPLKELLNPTLEVADFLEKYKMQPEQYQETLFNYLLKREDIYSVLIQPNFDDFIQLEIVKNEPFAFLDYVLGYFKIKKGKNLLDKKCILTKKGFFNVNEVFFDIKLSQAENPEILGNAIEKLTNLVVPHPDFLKFIQEDAFKMPATRQGTTWNNIIAEIPQKLQENTINADEKHAFFKFIRQVGDNAILEKIQLFTNNQNQPQLPKNLLAPDAEIPIWLEVFKIKNAEFKEELRPYLCRNEDIYANIVFPLWDTIIAQPAVLAENPANFYESVKNLYAQNRNNKNLAGKKYIFTHKHDGFESVPNIFYKETALQVRNYGALQRAIQKTTQLKTPHKDIYAFLKEQPFVTAENVFIKSLKIGENLTLQEDEAINVIQFADLNKESVFLSVVFSETEQEKSYLVEKKGSFSQAFAGKNKQKLHETILNLFPNKYKILPEKLFNQNFENKGLVGEEILTQELLKNASPELLAELVAESNNPTFQAHSIASANEILLREGVNYDKNSLEYQALQQLLQLYKQKDKQKDREIKALLQKLVVETAQGEQVTFGDLLYETEINFHIEKLGKYTLYLADILPKYGQYFTLLENILGQMPEGESLHKKFFGIGGEIPKEIVLNALKVDFATVENGVQLAFLVLMSRNFNTNIADFKVENAEQNEVFILNENATQNPTKNTQINDKNTQENTKKQSIFYFEAPIFIPKSAILHEKYAYCAEILKLDMGESKRSVFGFQNGELRLNPYIEKGIFKSLPWIWEESDAQAEENAENSLENAENVAKNHSQHNQNMAVDILSFAYHSWIDNPVDNIVIETPEYLNNTDIWGNEPHNWVKNDDISLDIELFPAWLWAWIDRDTEDKIAFLRAWGVHVDNSEVVKVRNYFVNDGEAITLKEIRDAQAKYPDFLLNTAKLLQEKGFTFAQHEEKFTWLRKLYQLQETPNPLLPLPYMTHALKEPTFMEGGGYVENLPFFGIGQKENAVFYFCDNDKAFQLQEKYGIYLHQLLDKASIYNENLTENQKEICFTCLELKVCPTLPIKIEEKLSRDLLLEKSFAWASDYYEVWKAETGYEIYLFEGEMPYTLWLGDCCISDFARGNALVEDKTIFVNAQIPQIEEALFGIVPQPLLLQLLRLKNQQLAPQTPSISKENAFTAQKKYIFLREFLEQYGSYALGDFEEESKKGTVFNLVKNDAPILIVLKEIQNQKLRFGAKEIKALNEPNTELYLWNGEHIQASSLDELLHGETDIELQLDLRAMGVDMLKKLAKVL